MKREFLQIITLLVISLSLLVESSLAAKYSIVFPDGRSASLKSSSFSNREYISLNQIHSLLFSRYQFTPKKSIIYNSGYRLKVSQGSFYILQEAEDGIKIAQMSSPAISVDNLIYVPLESFFLSLPTLGLYNTEIRDNKITLKGIKAKPHSLDEQIYQGAFSDMESDDIIDDKDSYEFENDFAPNDEYEEKEIDNDFLAIDHFSSKNVENLNETTDHSEYPEEKTNLSNKGLKIFDDFNRIDNKRDFSKTQKFERIEKVKEDFTYSEPALKFSFIYSSNYILDGFKNIPDKKASFTKPIKAEEIMTMPHNNQSTPHVTIKQDTKEEKQVFPPNVYVLPKNLIRKELGENK
jgi:hypothetical protein